MSVTPKDIQALREMTGAGMMDCKKALLATDGDQDKAIEFLREKGLAAVAKKSSRIAAEGACYAVVCDCGSAAIVEVNSETDFAAKSDAFQAFIKGIANTVNQANPADIDALKAAPYAGGTGTVEAELQNKVFTIGENIQIRRFVRYADPVSAAYVHMGGKIAVLVHMDVSDNLTANPEVQAIGRDVAMQITAMNPRWLSEETADQNEVAKEKAILIAQLKEDEKNKNKPDAVLEKIVEGRVRKFLAENCLLAQSFVKDADVTVAQYVANKAKELGGSITVSSFVRYETGEGLAKKEDDFAAEVARMTK